MLLLDNARPKLPKDFCLCYRFKWEGILKSKFHWLATAIPLASILDFHKWQSEPSLLYFTGWTNHKLMDRSEVIGQPGWKGTCFLLAHVLLLNTFSSHLLLLWVQFSPPYRRKITLLLLQLGLFWLSQTWYKLHGQQSSHCRTVRKYSFPCMQRWNAVSRALARKHGYITNFSATLLQSSKRYSLATPTFSFFPVWTGSSSLLERK